MKKHASKSKLCISFMLYSLYIHGSLYMTVIFINLKELIFISLANVSNDNVIFLLFKYLLNYSIIRKTNLSL